MYIIKCKDYWFDKTGVTSIAGLVGTETHRHEYYLTVGELIDQLKWLDKDEAICVQTSAGKYRIIDDIKEEKV